MGVRTFFRILRLIVSKYSLLCKSAFTIILQKVSRSVLKSEAFIKLGAISSSVRTSVRNG